MPGEAAEPPAAEVVPAPSAALVRSCAHDAWAPLLRDHAHRSETIPLPPVRLGARCADARRLTRAAQAFVEYLLADGVQLRSDSGAVRCAAACAVLCLVG